MYQIRILILQVKGELFVKKYTVKRVCYMIFTIFAVATLTFFLMRSIPGDPLANMARSLPEQTKANFYAKYGLDKPLFEQYLMYIKGLLHFDLGESITYPGRSVMSEIARTSPISGMVGGIALIIGTVIGVLLGIVAALKKNQWPDYIVMFIAIIGSGIRTGIFDAVYLCSKNESTSGIRLGNCKTFNFTYYCYEFQLDCNLCTLYQIQHA